MLKEHLVKRRLLFDKRGGLFLQYGDAAVARVVYELSCDSSQPGDFLRTGNGWQGGTVAVGTDGGARRQVTVNITGD